MKLSRQINTISNRYYHVKDYRGDVRAVIGGDGTLKEVNNYYPYGALMGGGCQAVQPYKYGGKELDRQNGLDWYDSMARWYDALSGRTPTMDPLSEKYYSISPYAWCGGNPIRNIDPDGNIIRAYINETAYDFKKGEDGTYGFYNQEGELYQNDDYTDFLMQTSYALGMLQTSSVGYGLISELINSDRILKLNKTTSTINNAADIENDEIFWDPENNEGGYAYFLDDRLSNYRPAFIGLGHELAHIYDSWMGTIDTSEWFKMPIDGKTKDKSEIFATKIENMLRADFRLPQRTYYHYYREKGRMLPYEPSKIPSSIGFPHSHNYPFGSIMMNYFFNNW